MTIEKLYDIYLRHPSIQTDTRQLRPGDLFFALKGPNFNGNLFAAKALELGAAYLVLDETPAGLDLLPPDASNRLIVVPDVLETLQQLALHHRRQFDIPFLAITGSNGKTTTKELIHAVLASIYITYTTKGNLNNHIGIPLTILSVGRDAQFAVIEMGANHQKEIESYCRYALPTHGIITNIGKAHLEGFGGPEGVKKGKGELYDFLRSPAVPPVAAPAAAEPAATEPAKRPAPLSKPAAAEPTTRLRTASLPSTPGGTAFVLTDSPDLPSMSRGIPHIITYGSSAPRLPNIPDILGAALPAENSFLHVDILRGAETGPIHTQLVGDYNLPNVLVAVAVGKHFGVPDNFIRESIESYTPSNSRSQLIERSGLHIILDAYNANPSSMRAAIENFARLRIPTQPKDQPRGFQHGEVFDLQEFEIPPKVLILGAMAELGPESLAEHQGIVDLIARYPWEKVVLVGGDFLKLELPANFLRFTDSPSAAQWLKAAGTDLRNAYLLIKGSRSQKMEAVLE